MSEMVERVMKAMQDVPPLPPLAGGYYATDWEGMARAAIAALREPTEGMERVAWDGGDYGPAPVAWRDMIDEALK